jgi:hypothetical protein
MTAAAEFIGGSIINPYLLCDIPSLFNKYISSTPDISVKMDMYLGIHCAGY